MTRILLNLIVVLLFSIAASAMTMQYAYRVLGLESGASQQEIKTAYHKLALLNHPGTSIQYEKHFIF